MNPRNHELDGSDPHAGQATLARRRVCWRTATAFLALLAGAVVGRWVASLAVLLGMVAGLWLLVAWFHRFFFRDPEPRVPAGEGMVVAPAHGRVDAIEETREPEFIQGPAWRVSIFLSVFDVHVQYAPVAGRIALARHRPGQFLNALRAQSAQCNENVLIGIESLEQPGERWAVRQIAGTIARRIESWVQEGDSIGRGQRLGMIRYGSRCDLYLPQSARITVRVGERVVGGETVMAIGRRPKTDKAVLSSSYNG